MTSALEPTAGPAATATGFRGNDRLLFGIILGVLTFWLFAQTTLNIAPDMQKDLGLDTSLMNIAVAITALFSGIFIVFIGGLADRIGRVRIVMVGFVLSIIGSLLIGFAPRGTFALYFLLSGRALQGLSGACIMPASLALVKTFWDGEARQRAVSMWSIGSWGGSGFCSLFGGFVAQNFGWRWIFFASVVIALLGMALMKGMPESKAEGQTSSKFDLAGVLTFMVAMIALQILVTQGNNLGWTSPSSLSLAAVTLVFGWLFFRIESRIANAFVDLKLFHNPTYTGATISNFMLNGAAGTLLVSLQLVQLGGNMTAQQAGMLTLGYAIAIVAFIRVGEKLLRRFGARKPMIQGCLITGHRDHSFDAFEPHARGIRSLRDRSATRCTVLVWPSTPHPRRTRRSQACPTPRSVPAPASTRWPRLSAPRSVWRFPRLSSPRSGPIRRLSTGSKA